MSDIFLCGGDLPAINVVDLFVWLDSVLYKSHTGRVALKRNFVYSRKRLNVVLSYCFCDGFSLKGIRELKKMK